MGIKHNGICVPIECQMLCQCGQLQMLQYNYNCKCCNTTTIANAAIQLQLQMLQYKYNCKCCNTNTIAIINTHSISVGQNMAGCGYLSAFGPPTSTAKKDSTPKKIKRKSDTAASRRMLKIIKPPKSKRQQPAPIAPPSDQIIAARVNYEANFRKQDLEAQIDGAFSLKNNLI